MRPKGLALVVEDEDAFRMALAEAMGERGWHVLQAAGIHQAREFLDAGGVDLALLDIRLPDGDGLGLLRELRRRVPEAIAVVMTAYADVDAAVDAMRLGAADFLKKPFDLEELFVRMDEWLERKQLREENRRLRARVRAIESGHELIGQHPEIRRLRETAALLADSPSTVLITGESGSGKEVLAHLIHKLGPRADKPFVAVNCGAIPEDLLESELFGHVKGAFTGAVRNRPGRFELAQGGTIFLDEIGEMSPKLQVKLLRVLQERRIEPVGGDRSIPVDVRVIAATNRDLEKAIEAGEFREDLFYRLNVIPLRLPPLRERGDDVLLLAEHFIERFNARLGTDIRGIAPEARELMLAYRWPGNVRELQNLVERVATLKREGLIEAGDLPSRMLDPGRQVRQDVLPPLDGVERIDLKALVDEFETRLILHALERCGWNKNKAARFLTMNRTTLVEKVKKKGLQPPRG